MGSVTDFLARAPGGVAAKLPGGTGERSAGTQRGQEELLVPNCRRTSLQSLSDEMEEAFLRLLSLFVPDMDQASGLFVSFAAPVGWDGGSEVTA